MSKLEKAIERCNLFIQAGAQINVIDEVDGKIQLITYDASAIETVLEELNNSIPKQYIQEKIEKLNKEINEIRKVNRFDNNATKYDYLIIGKRDILEELLEGK